MKIFVFLLLILVGCASNGAPQSSSSDGGPTSATLTDAPVEARIIRGVFVGDSNTRDPQTFEEGGNNGNGYRRMLLDLLASDPSLAGYTLDVDIGTELSGEGPVRHHEGQTGATVRTGITRAETRFGEGAPLHPVNVFLWAYGTNNASSDKAAGTYAADTREYLKLLHQLEPNASFHLLGIPPSEAAGYQTRIDRMNEELEETASDLGNEGLSIKLTPLTTLDPRRHIGTDGTKLHLNREGMHEVARAAAPTVARLIKEIQ